MGILLWINSLTSTSKSCPVSPDLIMCLLSGILLKSSLRRSSQSLQVLKKKEFEEHPISSDSTTTHLIYPNQAMDTLVMEVDTALTGHQQDQTGSDRIHGDIENFFVISSYSFKTFKYNEKGAFTKTCREKFPATLYRVLKNITTPPADRGLNKNLPPPLTEGKKTLPPIKHVPPPDVKYGTSLI